MSRKYIAFDVETYKILEEGEDLMENRPLGISCAAVQASDSSKPVIWHAKDWGDGNDVDPEPIPLGFEGANHLLGYLYRKVYEGYTLATWNGNFDLLMLADEAQAPGQCAELAKTHIDPMFQIFCVKGFPIGLKKTAEAFGLPVLEDIKGAEVPEKWQNGTVEDRKKILEYVGNDAWLTLRITEDIEETGQTSWITKRGYIGHVDLRPLLTVEKARELPLPDTSWMTVTIPRDSFYNWVFNRE